MNETHHSSAEPQADDRLRVAVERVVRPVFAPEVRKLAMRRELIAHLTEAYRDELTTQSNDDAIRCAVERLGPAEALTADLQSGVSLDERVGAGVEHVLRCPRGGSLGWYAARQSLIAATLFTAVFAVGCFLSTLGLLPPKSADSGALRAMVWVVLAFGGCAGLGGYAGGRVRRAIETRGAWAAWAALGGFALLAFGWATFWLCFGMPGAASSARFAACWMLVSAGFAVALPVLAWLDLRERREIDQWLALDLDTA